MQNSTAPPPVDYADALDAAVAGTTDTLAGNSIDMINAHGVDFLIFFGTITAAAVTTVIVQESDDDSAWVTVTGTSTSIAVADDDSMCVIRLIRSNFARRYLRVSVTRATANAVIEKGVAMIYQNAGAITVGGQSDTVLIAAGVTTI